jgi:hypothetical protein
MLALVLLGLLAGAGDNPVVDAVARCAAAVEPASFDVAPLTSDGWAEDDVAGAPVAVGGGKGLRLFNKADAGAVIVVKLPDDGGRPSCHVLFRRPNAAIDTAENDIGQHFGGKTLKIGAALTLFDSGSRPIMVSMSRRLDKGQVLADVVINPQKPKTSPPAGQ